MRTVQHTFIPFGLREREVHRYSKHNSCWHRIIKVSLQSDEDSSTHFHSLTSCCWFLENFIVLCGKFESPYPGKAQQLQERYYPLLSVCAVFLCVQTMVRLPMFGIFNVHTWCWSGQLHTGAVQTQLESLYWNPTLGEKSLVAPSNPRQHRAWLFSRTLYQ